MYNIDYHPHTEEQYDCCGANGNTSLLGFEILFASCPLKTEPITIVLNEKG